MARRTTAAAVAANAAASPDGLSAQTCRCGKDVAGADMAGTVVLVDKKADERGAIHGYQLAGRWIFTEADTTNVNGLRKNYVRHRCPATQQSDLRRRMDDNDTAGPCAGACGTKVPRRYGKFCQIMCDPCREKRAAWLATQR
jgi:hypothetical protein